MSSWPIFYFGTIFSVVLSEFSFIPVSSPCNSFFQLYILLIFLLCSFCSSILFQNCFVSYTSGCGFVLCILHQRFGRIYLLYFRRFLNCFVVLFLFYFFWWDCFFFSLYHLILSRYPLSLPSFAHIFWFISSSR